MTDRLVGRGYGRVVELRGDAESRAAAREVLPFWWVDVEDPPQEPDHVAELHRPESAAFVVREMEHWIAEHAVDVVFVHAAAVAFDGRVILLPGRSHAGKTTLCAELLRAGGTYLSDEYAVLDADGFVHPYPRPLHVRDGADRVPTPASDFGAETATGPLPVGLVAVLTHDEQRGWDVEDISPAQAVLDVLANTVCAQTRPAVAVDAISASVANARYLRGTRGCSEKAARPLHESVMSPQGPRRDLPKGSAAAKSPFDT